MPSDDQILSVIQQWSGQRPPKMSQNLEDWWGQTASGSSHSTLPFDPDGIEDLVRRLQQAFPSSPALESGDFGSGGSVKTVEDLSQALLPAMAADLDQVTAAAAAPARKAVKKSAPKTSKAAAKKAGRATSQKRKSPSKPTKKAAPSKKAAAKTKTKGTSRKAGNKAKKK